MALPREVIEKIPSEGGIVALRMKVEGRDTDFYFLIRSKEGPNDLREFSLGSASAMATAGTGWDDIQDSNNRYHLEPEFENYLYQVFYGITPSYAWLYRRYPANVDLGSLVATRAIGGNTGYVDGGSSPLRSPSAQTEFWTLKGNHPSFIGYHPYAVPTSITVRVSFYITKFFVDYLRTPTEEQIEKAIVRTMGGVGLFDAPEWLRR